MVVEWRRRSRISSSSALCDLILPSARWKLQPPVGMCRNFFCSTLRRCLQEMEHRRLGMNGLTVKRRECQVENSSQFLPIIDAYSTTKSTISSWPMCVHLCVSIRVHLSRLRLTQQSLKRVGHEGKLCLKGKQRHPPCLSRVPLS